MRFGFLCHGQHSTLLPRSLQQMLLSVASRDWIRSKKELEVLILGVDSRFFSTIVLSKNRIRFPWVSGGFLERFGSLERMDLDSQICLGETSLGNPQQVIAKSVLPWLGVSGVLLETLRRPFFWAGRVVPKQERTNSASP